MCVCVCVYSPLEKYSYLHQRCYAAVQSGVVLKYGNEIYAYCYDFSLLLGGKMSYGFERHILIHLYFSPCPPSPALCIMYDDVSFGSMYAVVSTCLSFLDRFMLPNSKSLSSNC